MLTSCKILNRDQIKLLAIITMTFNHISHVLMTPGSVLAEVFEDIGYFTAMTMCFFLTEGYRYTRSKKAYAQRLFVFALISQIPYVLAVGFFQLNVLFTLLACFLIFCVMDSSLSKLQKNCSWQDWSSLPWSVTGRSSWPSLRSSLRKTKALPAARRLYTGSWRHSSGS